MTEVSKKVLYWAPRVSCIAFALFLSLFAMDVFGEGLGFWRTLFALFLHLIPTLTRLHLLDSLSRWLRFTCAHQRPIGIHAENPEAPARPTVARSRLRPKAM